MWKNQPRKGGGIVPCALVWVVSALLIPVSPAPLKVEDPVAAEVAALTV